jgi:hypothetical protein
VRQAVIPLTKSARANVGSGYCHDSGERVQGGLSDPQMRCAVQFAVANQITTLGHEYRILASKVSFPAAYSLATNCINPTQFPWKTHLQRLDASLIRSACAMSLITSSPPPPF